MPNSYRLTHPGLLYPYQSSWAVYLKLLEWNGVRDLRRLLELLRPEMPQTTKHCNWWDLDRLTLRRLECAMGLPLGKLARSFIRDWFPLPTSVDSGAASVWHRPLIRHCPTCISYGFHPVVFFFQFISYCPWHHEELQVCYKCTGALSSDYAVKTGVYGAANKCEHLSCMLDVIAPIVAPAEFNFAVSRWCDRLYEWTAKCFNIVGHNAYDFMVDPLGSKADDHNAALDYFIERLGDPVQFNRQPKRMSALLMPRSKLGVELPYHDTAVNIRAGRGELQPQSDVATQVQLSKSVRRYLFRAYIRRHRKCLARLKGLPKENWNMLCDRAVCPCVLAYLIVFLEELWPCHMNFCMA